MDTGQETLYFSSDSQLSHVRLDKYLTDKFPTFSRHYFQKLIKEKRVLVNHNPAAKRYLLADKDVITVTFNTPRALDIQPFDLSLDILYEDEDLIAINKPSGLVVHPAPGHYEKTLANALVHYLGRLQDFSDTQRPGIIHRLDKDTSGVILCAKTLYAHKMMTQAFADKTVKKNYLALCHNKPSIFCINKPIKRHPVKRKEMSIQEGGRASITQIELLKHQDHLSLILAQPVTGRTHQIRLHLKSINCPIVSDPIYGSIHPSYPRLMLHAYQLEFIHPRSKKDIILRAPADDLFQKVLTLLGKEKDFQ